MKFVKYLYNTLKPFVLSSSIVVGSILSYYNYLTTQNRKQFEQEQENDEQYKDRTRDTNEYFGINWGYKADEIIKDKIDAGDIFLIKYECDQCLYIRDILFCKYLQTFNHEQDYDSLGFAFRNQQGLLIIVSQFGQTKIIPYQQFISQPFLKELSLRKLNLKDSNIEKDRNLYKRIKQHFLNIQKQENFQEQCTYNYFQNLNIKHSNLSRSPEKMAFTYCKSIGLINFAFEKVENFEPYISDYDTQSPFFFLNEYEFDNKIVIRSNINKEISI